MLETSLKIVEIMLIASGLLLITKSVFQYGTRTRDWSGVVKMFYKRVSMNVAEYKAYRLGVSAFILGVLVRIVNLTLWPF
ncbi:CDK5RAP3 family protein [Photobacterium sp. TY1-4]|uniref:CDK5RAP3 family protein n=1 Tax=Photobacterium sp. TY1-4 TaxID=2899122 RepID=UPI0021BFF3FD|nr:CDK5RAP3 family protein [Photobacterium sp. TY1-4]UXI03930.1 CDK5RAP3 family protein [Photobacterium sp. TY1-4]